MDRAGPVLLVALTVALFALGVAAILSDRYAVGQAGGLPARLDKLTGQVIACIPQRGCFVIIPAGEPPLTTIKTPPAPAPTPVPAPAQPQG